MLDGALSRRRKTVKQARDLGGFVKLRAHRDSLDSFTLHLRQPHEILFGCDQKRVTRSRYGFQPRDLRWRVGMVIGVTLCRNQFCARCFERPEELFRTSDAGERNYLSACKGATFLLEMRTHHG